MGNPMNRSLSRATLLIALLSSPISVSGEDWVNWRGPNYDGHSRETGFVKSWDKLDSVWAQDIGAGFSGISCANGRVYTCGTADGSQVLYCMKAENGKVLWKTAIGAGYREAQGGSGPRSTPTIDGDRVYIMGAGGLVACCDVDSGSQVWSRQFKAVPQWGYSGSVLIQGNLAIITAGGSGGGMQALDKTSGDDIWACGADSDSGYSTPYPFEFEGENYVCGFLGKSVVIAELKTGREVLSMPWKTDWNVNAATPIFHEGYLFLSSGYNTGCGLYRLSQKDKKLKADEVWRSKVLMNKFQTPVLYEGKLYSYDQKSFKCVDFMTGERVWQERGKHGTVVMADGHLIALSQKGKLRIGRASPKGFEPTGSAQILDDRCWTVPTLSNGRLYARNIEGRLICVDLNPGKEGS